jgi:CBS-domain-containing membrane protein
MCSGSDTFGSIIKRLAAQRLHRIYIVDSDGLPTGLVSLTDVLSVLVRSPAETTP